MTRKWSALPLLSFLPSLGAPITLDFWSVCAWWMAAQNFWPVLLPVRQALSRSVYRPLVLFSMAEMISRLSE